MEDNIENINRFLIVNIKDDKPLHLISSYFGIADNFEEFISFWKDNEDAPFLMLNKEIILSISIRSDGKNDNSKTDKKKHI